jgi:hypothetical protein
VDADGAAQGEQQTLEAALVAEACRKSGLVWLAVPGGGPPRPAWHVWHDEAVFLVGGGGEQPLPELDGVDRVLVTVRSKDKGARLVTFVARPSVVAPGAPGWDAAAKELAASRLNARDADAQIERWARSSTVLRLTPTGEVPERPGTMSSDSHAAPPVPTPATTRGPLPYLVRRRRRS